MVAVSVKTAGVNAFVLALTPSERWNAARRLDSASTDQQWFIILSIAAIILLTLLLIAVSYNNRTKERKVTNRVFDTFAKRVGLSRHERQILLDIAKKLRLKQAESIFTMSKAFDRGAAELTKDILAIKGARASKNLSNRLSVIREKLGFETKSPDSASGSNKASSKHIPTGKQLHMTRHQAGDLANIESTVIDNNDEELTVKLKVSLESKPGELWFVRYYFGASVWEFETSSISCYGNILVLKHSNNIRFINRRRFLRVPVNRPTFIARFPFTRMLLPDIGNGKESGRGPADVSTDNWGPPEFVPASVTELAGPGLRIEAPLEVKVGDRVLVILKLTEDDSKPGSQRNDKTESFKIVENIGEVRHTRTIKDGFSIAVELTGLTDPNINELIRATNAASLKNRPKTKTTQAVNESNDNKSEEPEPAVVQGV